MKKVFSFSVPAIFIIGLYLFTAFVSDSLNTSQSVSGNSEHQHHTIRQKQYVFEPNNCVSCHVGIEHIRSLESDMMQEILQIAEKSGYPGNDCIVCHGGNPDTRNKDQAHRGTVKYFQENKGPKTFYPDPGSPWINEHTCGVCHQEQVKTQFTSLMFTEAGKIQGSLWGFGAINGYQHNIGNYNVTELDPHAILGTEKYKAYIQQLKELEPQVFPAKMKALPPAPTADDVEENPQLAVYTYLRQECQRCHTGNKGRQKRGDYRGMGCSSCHIPYANEGFYEGSDSIIKSLGRGHLLTHQIQGSREAKVHVNNHIYSGIPVETCTTCHDRGKRIGTSFQGLMETAYSSPFMGDGEEQPKLHTKHYLHLHEDIHKSKGMLCQDCHTSIDVHSDGTLAGSTLAPVEIECQDCHGTTARYPWELPLGYGDEVGGLKNISTHPRGLSYQIADYLKKGTEYPPQDGYLLTARGNPFGNVVKTGDSVVVHTAAGKDIVLKPLKYLADNHLLSLEGEVAMQTISKHTETMECYACHARWAPQCYGCHIKIDYSQPCKRKLDWVAMGQAHDLHGLTADAKNQLEQYLIDGEITETRSYLRWENPPLAVNGENRISPAIPGCQTAVTVIGKNGKPLLQNHIFKIPNVEGAESEGQLGIDISPVQPHTISKSSRSCEECHTNPQAMGYGIAQGELYENPAKEYVVDITDAFGNVLSENAQTQIGAIDNLTMDWSRFVSEEGKQLQTVGHHFSGSRPLNNAERQHLDRRGVCFSCHQTIPQGDIAVNLLTHIKNVSGKTIDNSGHRSLLSKILHISAWAQLMAVVLLTGLAVIIMRKIILHYKK